MVAFATARQQLQQQDSHLAGLIAQVDEVAPLKPLARTKP